MFVRVPAPRSFPGYVIIVKGKRLEVKTVKQDKKDSSTSGKYFSLVSMQPISLSRLRSEDSAYRTSSKIIAIYMDVRIVRESSTLWRSLEKLSFVTRRCCQVTNSDFLLPMYARTPLRIGEFRPVVLLYASHGRHALCFASCCRAHLPAIATVQPTVASLRHDSFVCSSLCACFRVSVPWPVFLSYEVD